MDVNPLVLSVAEQTRERLSLYLQELDAMCAIDSGSYYKPGLDSLARWLAERMERAGMKARIIENELWGNDVLGVVRGDGTGNVLLLGHTDTVYPVGTAVQRPLRLEGELLYGPGVSDMKGCILAAIYAVEALLATGYRDFGEIRLLCVSDEEILERHSLDTIREVCQDCHGALVLEAAKENGAIVSARKGNGVYKLTIQGRSAHAGVEPERGRNAILELAHQLLRLQSLQGWREGLTINPGLITGGSAVNVVPESAQAQIDLRYLELDDKLETEARWQELLKEHLIEDVQVTLEAMPDIQPPLVRTPKSLQLVEYARSLAEMLGFPLEHVLTGGASDASHTSRFGVPTLDGLGPIGGNDHSPREYLLMSSVASRVALLGGLIAIVGQSD